MKFFKNSIHYFSLLVLVVLLASCEKVDIKFVSSDSEIDPNITYFDNYGTSIATYRPDSFLTSSHEVMSLGYHYDSVFGFVKAGSYAQINLPLTNPVLNKSVIFDSLELIIRSSGEFYGDSLKSMKINVYRLAQNIKDGVNGDVYYNNATFNYYPATIGQQEVSLNGKHGKAIHIKLSDELGKELLSKFRTNDDDISSSEKFVNYFKGIFLNADSLLTNSIAFFNAPADSAMIRLTYHENSLYSEKKTIEFSYTKEKQFNNISFRHTSPNFDAFVNNKTPLIESTASGNQSYLNTNQGSVIKISFPDLLNLKELHPYIKVVKAILVIKPDRKSFTAPYQLPKTLNLYTTNETNSVIGGVYDNAVSPGLQTGSLVIDYLYGADTYYSYDITGFIDSKIDEGQFSKSALLLYPAVSNFDAGLRRLIVNNQNNGNSVQLKLYVLGL